MNTSELVDICEEYSRRLRQLERGLKYSEQETAREQNYAQAYKMILRDNGIDVGQPEARERFKRAGYGGL